jgi:hypothetical protein
MFKHNLSKAIVSLLKRIGKGSKTAAKRMIRTLMRSLMVMTRRNKLPIAGFMLAFVLPTVTMVMLVVVLLTLAITLRSFDRAQNARNVRVNEAVLAAATPAIDRARAKINFLLKEDPQRPLATPSDNEMYRMMSATTPQDLYSFGDETRLKVRYDLNSDGTIKPLGVATDPDPLKDTKIEDNEVVNTAWRYGVDTDNNGKIDTYTIYGIFFRSPDRDPATGKFTRARRPLEARTPPMPGKISDPACAGATGTSASLVGDSGWYKSEGRLKKSFFVYTVNIPITNPTAANEEAFKGTQSVSALEYQQDQSRIPLSNNAVVYEDDLEISAYPPLTLNGRIFTNSNLLVTTGSTLNLSQVSSPKSCFYEQENSKIVVGGNVVSGDSSTTGVSPVTVDLFKKGAKPVLFPKIDGSTKSVSNTALEVLYNTKAFADRLALLVSAQMLKATTTDPTSVQQLTKAPDLITSRRQALEGYFKERLRKVTFAEVALGVDGAGSYTPTTVLAGSGDTLRPADGTGWNLPTGWTATLGTTSVPGLTILPAQLNATYPNPEQPLTEENLIGDRIQVGNNLPAKRWDGAKFVGLEPPQEVDGTTKWNAGDTTKKRTRSPRVTQLADVGATDRGGFWEQKAAEKPKTAVDGIGGLRVITAGGVYERVNSFLPPPQWVAADPVTGNPTTKTAATDTYDDPATTTITEQYPVVWPDTMPMSPVLGVQRVYNNGADDTVAPNVPAGKSAIASQLLPATSALLPSAETGSIDPNTKKYAKGDLRMRATAVYHYATNAYDTSAATPDQTPIACISSYYDPSTSSTARNLSGLPADVSGVTTLGTRDASIGSNNGIVYGPPTTARPTAASTVNPTTDLLGGAAPSALERQANYVFPNGRFANKPLRDALLKAKTDRTLADNAAIDATNCSFDILKGAISPSTAVIPHGAIKEISFLNAREVKAIDKDDPNTNVDETFTLSSPLTDLGGKKKPAKLTGNYDLALEERQPLEIRATVLDINVLRAKTITQANTTGPTPEYLLPNSGIIYATRDDALPDRSDRQPDATGKFDENTSKTVSPTDSLLDPTRRPNGIMLINGDKLFRGGATPTPVTTVEQVVKEKGITLVSNLPVYIKGEFNKHTQEEFKEALTTSNFYTRSTLNPSFACRQGDPRISGCTGDNWRPATVLADAITLLSPAFREGFRNEGDFDLNNNVGTAAVGLRRDQGFYNNNFVTNGLSSGAFNSSGALVASGGMTDNDYLTIGGNGLNSSYFNNFVTPVQRRGDYPEYLMEVCTKLPVSECGEDDWFINPVNSTKASAKVGLPYTQSTIITDSSDYKAGTTVDPPVPQLQRFPRRVAFKRNITAGSTKNDLDDTPTNTKVTALGISSTPKVVAVDTSNIATMPRNKANSLWFAIGTSGSSPYNPAFGNTQPLYFLNAVNLPNANDGFRFIDGLIGSTTLIKIPKITAATTSTPSTPALKHQPLLMPILQIHATDVTTATSLPDGNNADNTKWLSPVPSSSTPLEFNLIVGAGDIPSLNRGNGVGEFAGGLQNLPRFIENWGSGGEKVTTKINGSFVQLNRSAYSTSPYSQLLQNGLPQSAFLPTISGTVANWYSDDTINRYRISNNQGATPFFIPPGRTWGFDVGLLSQPPDLFTQRFTTPSTQTLPAEYFREVNRDDEWVKTLLCAVIDDATGTTKAVNSNLRPTSFCISKTGEPP